MSRPQDRRGDWFEKKAISYILYSTCIRWTLSSLKSLAALLEDMGTRNIQLLSPECFYIFTVLYGIVNNHMEEIKKDILIITLMIERTDKIIEETEKYRSLSIKRKQFSVQFN
jgi:hypothetical protein